MSFDSLAEELIDWCLRSVDMDCLRALRLVNRTLASPATRRPFTHVIVEPTESSAQKARLVLEVPKLNPIVKKLTLRTSPNPVPNPYSYDCEGEAELPEAYESLLGEIGRFRNLCAVELKFSDECAATGTQVSLLEKSVWETTEYRSTVLQMLVESLNDEEHPASKVRELTIENLQDIVDKKLASSKDFKAVLSRMDSLSLQIATETDDAAPESSLYIPTPYRFFGNDLRHYWLDPVREKLTDPKLYAGQTYWGYLPYCNLPGLHFPTLTSLSLGNMTFTHD